MDIPKQMPRILWQIVSQFSNFSGQTLLFDQKESLAIDAFCDVLLVTGFDSYAFCPTEVDAHKDACSVGVTENFHEHRAALVLQVDDVSLRVLKSLLRRMKRLINGVLAISGKLIFLLICFGAIGICTAHEEEREPTTTNGTPTPTTKGVDYGFLAFILVIVLIVLILLICCGVSGYLYYMHQMKRKHKAVDLEAGSTGSKVNSTTMQSENYQAASRASSPEPESRVNVHSAGQHEFPTTITKDNKGNKEITIEGLPTGKLVLRVMNQGNEIKKYELPECNTSLSSVKKTKSVSASTTNPTNTEKISRRSPFTQSSVSSASKDVRVSTPSFRSVKSKVTSKSKTSIPSSSSVADTTNTLRSNASTPCSVTSASKDVKVSSPSLYSDTSRINEAVTPSSHSITSEASTKQSSASSSYSATTQTLDYSTVYSDMHSNNTPGYVFVSDTDATQTYTDDTQSSSCSECKVIESKRDNKTKRPTTTIHAEHWQIRRETIQKRNGASFPTKRKV
ncbi:hypothetical protein Ddc_07478 [Ditylenchus destructor]|nr:hypothetical protein Ddc_07478 [Ditylenchus destructor]